MKLKPDEPPGTIEKLVTQEVQDLMTARWVADMIGVAAELELADLIKTGGKTAEEIAKVKGLHPTSLYRLLRGLASYGIFAEQEDGTFVQTPRSDALRKDFPHSAWGMAQLTTRPWSVRAWMELGHCIRAGTPAFAVGQRRNVNILAGVGVVVLVPPTNRQAKDSVSNMFMGCNFSNTSTSTLMNWNCLPKRCAVFPSLPAPRW